MPPRITCPAIEAAVEGVLRKSFELVANADPTPPDERDAAWEQANLPNHMSGVGIGGHSSLCPAS
jgi:hypothetical protein